MTPCYAVTSNQKSESAKSAKSAEILLVGKKVSAHSKACYACYLQSKRGKSANSAKRC